MNMNLRKQGGELFPELFGQDLECGDHERSAFDPVIIGAAQEQQGDEGLSLIKDTQSIPEDKEELAAMISDLQKPLEQVALRYFIPLKNQKGTRGH